jgi:hypothetical protein
MTKTELVGRRKLAQLLADVFTESAEAVTHASDAGEKFFAIASSLQDLQPRLTSIDPQATAQLTDQAAEGAFAVGSALAVMAYEMKGQRRVSAILDLAGGLDRIGAALMSGADSVAAGRQCGTSPDRRVLDVQARAGTLAITYQLKADHLRSSVGLGFLSRQSYMFPSSDECSCGGADGRNVSATLLRVRESAALLTVDEPELHFALDGLATVADSTASLFRDLGLLLVSVPVALLVPCPNLCTANTLQAGPLLMTATAVMNAAGTLWVPTFVVRWVGCCACTCCAFLTQNRRIRIPTTHTVNTPAIPTTRPIGTAITLAQTAGGAEVTGFGTAGFVANPAITPPLAAPVPSPPGVGCPAC